MTTCFPISLIFKHIALFPFASLAFAPQVDPLQAQPQGRLPTRLLDHPRVLLAAHLLPVQGAPHILVVEKIKVECESL